MGEPRTVLCVVGTRPEAVKMAPVVQELRRRPWARVRVLATAQHREMLDQVLGLFAIAPDRDLDLMRPNQTLAALTARLLGALDEALEQERPWAVLAQGDTTTVLATALACFYRRITFGHVEAGLRTGDLAYPFPEEMNRSVAGRLASVHFAPTASARENLLREGVAPGCIHVTGNTVIDALLQVAAREAPPPEGAPPGARLLLVTAHRRENFGAPLAEICRALLTLVERNPDVHVLYPVHLNPNVSEPVRAALGGHPRVTLCPPLDYLPFVAAMKRSTLILSDSGGVQEEAPALGKPVLVLRAETERPEAVAEGVVKLVGTDHDAIVGAAQRLLDDADAYRAMARGVSPYGDGHAAGRIADVLERMC
jgi:UDP-N-acetylglucosamine 2-epimerase (non-hydrolysing)